VATPRPAPETIPLMDPTLAMPAALLLHVPLPVTSLNADVDPRQILRLPVIDAGNGRTVAVVVV